MKAWRPNSTATASWWGFFQAGPSAAAERQWDLFRVPKPFDEAIQSVAAQLRYRAVFVLTTAEGNEVARSVAPMGYRHTTWVPLEPICRSMLSWGESPWWIGPVWWEAFSANPSWEVTTTFAISQEDLSKVAKTAVFLEKDTRDVGHSRTSPMLDPFAPGG